MAAKLNLTISGRTEGRRVSDGKRYVRMTGILSVEVQNVTPVTRLAVNVIGESACGWLESGSVKYHCESFITEEKVLFESKGGRPKLLKRGTEDFHFFFDIMRNQFFPSTCNMMAKSKEGLVRYATIKYKLCAEMAGNKRGSKDTTEIPFKVNNPIPLLFPSTMPPVLFDGEFHSNSTRQMPGDIIIVGTLNTNLLDIRSEDGIKVSLRVDNQTTASQVVNIHLREEVNLLARGRAKYACNEYRAQIGQHTVMANTRKNIITDTIKITSSKVFGTVESLENVAITYSVIVHIPQTNCNIAVPIKIGSLVDSNGTALITATPTGADNSSSAERLIM